jgi:hypothetical protein
MVHRFADEHSIMLVQFVEKAAAKAKTYKIGNTLDPGTHIGAQVTICTGSDLSVPTDAPSRFTHEQVGADA